MLFEISEREYKEAYTDYFRSIGADVVGVVGIDGSEKIFVVR